jgi:hypothetical protein
MACRANDGKFNFVFCVDIAVVDKKERWGRKMGTI